MNLADFAALKVPMKVAERGNGEFDILDLGN